MWIYHDLHIPHLPDLGPSRDLICWAICAGKPSALRDTLRLLVAWQDGSKLQDISHINILGNSGMIPPIDGL
jgi:hypothetical protein